MSSRRQLQVGDLLRDEVSQIIQREMNDPRLGFVSITRVEMSPDMRYAKLFVSVYATEDEQNAALHALESCRRIHPPSAGAASQDADVTGADISVGPLDGTCRARRAAVAPD